MREVDLQIKNCEAFVFFTSSVKELLGDGKGSVFTFLVLAALAFDIAVFLLVKQGVDDLLRRPELCLTFF